MTRRSTALSRFEMRQSLQHTENADFTLRFTMTSMSSPVGRETWVKLKGSGCRLCRVRKGRTCKRQPEAYHKDNRNQEQDPLFELDIFR